MKIYLTKADVREILAGHFGLEVVNNSTPKGKGRELVWDEMYWEGNEEEKRDKDCSAEETEI